MAPNNGRRIAKITLMVGPEVKVDALPRPCGDSREKFRRHYAILVMAAFGPRIREKQVHFVEVRPFRQRGQEVVVGGQEEMKVPKVRPVPLPRGASHTVRGDVDSDAVYSRLGGSIGRKKMAMAASDLPNKARARRYDLKKLAPQTITTFRDQLAVPG